MNTADSGPVPNCGLTLSTTCGPRAHYLQIGRMPMVHADDQVGAAPGAMISPWHRRGRRVRWWAAPTSWKRSRQRWPWRGGVRRGWCTLECGLYWHEHRLAGNPTEPSVREALLRAVGRS
jgi:hypothetical protein